MGKKNDDLMTLTENGIINSTNGRLYFDEFKMMDYIMEQNNILINDHSIFVYNGKYYEPLKENALHAIVSKKLKTPMYQRLYNINKKREAISYLKNNTFMINEQIYEEQNRRYLTLNNCLYDLEKDKIIEHTPDIFTTTCLPYSYVKGKTIEDAPCFNGYINTTFGDKKIIEYYQQILGYILYKYIPRPTIFIYYGPPGTGKSVSEKTQIAMIGNINCCSVPPEHFTSATKVSSMYHKMLNICGEIDENSFQRSVGALKDISDGGFITGKFLYHDPFEFEPYCKQIFATNEFPKFIDPTHALYDRIFILPFNNVFRGQKNEIINLENRIVKEMPAIFNWALEGLRRLKADDFYFAIPDSCHQQKKEFKLDNDPFYNFCEKCIEYSPDKKDKIYTRDLMDFYTKYAIDQFGKEVKIMDFRKLRRSMEAKGFKYSRSDSNRFYTHVKMTELGSFYKSFFLKSGS